MINFVSLQETVNFVTRSREKIINMWLRWQGWQTRIQAEQLWKWMQFSPPSRRWKKLFFTKSGNETRHGIQLAGCATRLIDKETKPGTSRNLFFPPWKTFLFEMREKSKVVKRKRQWKPGGFFKTNALAREVEEIETGKREGFHISSHCFNFSPRAIPAQIKASYLS